MSLIADANMEMQIQTPSPDLDPPVPEQNPDGVDVSQIQAMLDMEPIDRLRHHRSFMAFVWTVQTQGTRT